MSLFVVPELTCKQFIAQLRETHFVKKIKERKKSRKKCNLADKISQSNIASVAPLEAVQTTYFINNRETAFSLVWIKDDVIRILMDERHVLDLYNVSQIMEDTSVFDVQDQAGRRTLRFEFRSESHAKRFHCQLRETRIFENSVSSLDSDSDAGPSTPIVATSRLSDTTSIYSSPDKKPIQLDWELASVPKCLNLSESSSDTEA